MKEIIKETFETSPGEGLVQNNFNKRKIILQEKVQMLSTKDRVESIEEPRDVLFSNDNNMIGEQNLVTATNDVRFQVNILQETLIKNHITPVHDKSKVHQCFICQKHFTAKISLKNHLATVHDSQKPYICPNCKTCFGIKQSLQRHIAIVHAKLIAQTVKNVLVQNNIFNNMSHVLMPI